MTKTRVTALMAVVLIVQVACGGKRPPAAVASAPEPAAAPAPPPAPPPPPVAAAPPPAPALSEEELFARKTLEELNAEQPLGDALFDFDQSTLREEARATVRRNADWLQRWRSTRIAVEGHCDERGSSEYNLALGERRAAAVRNYLIDLGIESDRVVIVSKGEEAPVCSSSDEGCWQRNRRAHHVITRK